LPPLTLKEVMKTEGWLLWFFTLLLHLHTLSLL